MRFLFIFLFFAITLFTTPLFTADLSATESPEQIADRLQKKYDNMSSLVFDFYQHTEGNVTGRPKVGKGNAKFLKKDGRVLMRWDYTEPAVQVLISDGITFSMYFEEMNQQIITSAETLESDITYAFFTGKGKLTEDFEILPPDEHTKEALIDAQKAQVIKLIPKKPQSQMQSIHVWVTDDSLIGRLQIRDHFDTVTTLSFDNMEIDTLVEVAIDFFTFNPPAGTEIISQ